MTEFSTTTIESLNRTSTTDFPVVEFTMAITTIVFFVILAIVMFCMIIHLLYKTYTKWKKKKQNKEHKKLLFFLVTTVFGILCFQLSLLIIIIVVIQIFLLDDVIKSSTISSKFFFQSYPVFEYLIAILDSLGHLLMLLIFIGRFQYAFNNAIFNQSKWLIRSMYAMLIVLSLLSMFLIVYVIPSEIHKRDLLVLEIVWELCVESMILLILFLFVSNLYKLLKLSLLTHLKKNGNPKELLSEITKISLESSKSSNKKGSSKSGRNKKSKITLTIDGNVVDPIEPMSMNNKSANKSANSSIKVSGYQSADGNLTDGEDMDNDDNNKSSSKPYIGYSQTLEILTVMSKMTLLVIIAATASFLTIIGNFIIESHGTFNEKDIRTNEGLDHDAIWVFILPVFDMVITSFMLYLQFNFTHNVYRAMCHCLDSVFLQCMLGIIAYCWKIEHDEASSIMDKNEAKELQTKSTVTSDGSNPAPSAPSDDIEVQMQTLTVLQ